MAKFTMQMGRGCILIEAAPGTALIESDTFRAEARPRVLMWKGAESAEAHEIYGGKRTVIYIRHREASGLSDFRCHETVSEIDDYYVEARGVSLPIGDYVTIRVAGIPFVDYIIISNKASAIVLSGKRKVFIDKHGDEIDIYIA